MKEKTEKIEKNKILKTEKLEGKTDSVFLLG
jgi:hypothetical protein